MEAAFGLTIPIFVILMSVLGGRTHWLGPVIGATLIVTMQDRLSSAGFEGWNLIILGAILAVLVVIAPEGLQVRLRARWLPALGALVVVTGGLAVIGQWGGTLEWVVAGMLAAAALALAPVPLRRRQRDVVRVREPAGDAETARPDDGPGQAVETGEAEEPGLASAAAEPVVRTDPSDPVPGDVLVECRDVTRYFGGVRALEGVDLEFREGELIGLVGTNGSGKTTLVNLLSGAFRPTRGTISIAGRDTSGIPPHKIAHLGVARTYQIPKPFESMTVRDNVAMTIMFGRERRRLEQARQQAETHLELVGLTHRADAHPSAVNLHERQLLEMARAIASSPKVLLLDEALAGLNPAEIDQAVEVVRRIHQSGITIVIVEHLLRVVNQLATRMVVLDRGSLLADGAPRTVMQDPAVVSAYLGRRAHA